MWWWIGGGLLGFVIVVLALVALVDVLRNRAALNKAQLFAWLILVLVLPLLGLILWFTVGRKSVHDQPGTAVG